MPFLSSILGWEIGSLLGGGRLVVVPEAVRAHEDFHALLVTEHVNVLTQPSAVAVSPQGLDSVALLLGGEACPAEVVDGGRPAGDDQRVRPDRDHCIVECAADTGVGVADRCAGVARCLCWIVVAAVPAGWSVSCMSVPDGCGCAPGGFAGRFVACPFGPGADVAGSGVWC